MAFEGLTEKINNTFKKLRGKGRLKEADVKEAMREIRMALLEADVSYKVCKDFTKTVTERCVGTDVLESLTPAQMIVKIVNEELTKLMGSDTKHITFNPNGPTVVMLVGLQGAGKNTGPGADCQRGCPLCPPAGLRHGFPGYRRTAARRRAADGGTEKHQGHRKAR